MNSENWPGNRFFLISNNLRRGCFKPSLSAFEITSEDLAFEDGLVYSAVALVLSTCSFVGIYECVFMLAVQYNAAFISPTA